MSKFTRYSLGEIYFNKKNIMFSHHYNSFNKFIDQDIEEYLTNTDTTFYQRNDKKTIYKYKLNFSDIKISPPKTENKAIIFPREARDMKLTYAAELSAAVEEVQEKYDLITRELIETKIVGPKQRVILMNLPIMVKSKYCSLNIKYDSEEAKKECDFDPAGYFIVNGSEKVIVPQEKKAINKAIVDAHKPDKPYKIQVNSVSPDGNGLMQVMGLQYYDNKNSGKGKMKNGVIYLYNPLFEKINIVVLFRALGIETDKEIINLCTLGGSESIKREITKIMSVCIRNCVDDNNNLLDTREKCINHLIKNLRMDKRVYSSDLDLQYKEKVMEVERRIKFLLLPHINTSPYDKIKYIGYMIYKLLNYYIGNWSYDDIDSYVNKRIELEGDLFMELFQQNFKKTLTEIKKSFVRMKPTDDNPIDIIHTISQSSRNIQNKAFYAALSQGTFGTRVGVAQQLERLTYEQEVLLLRQVNSPTKSSTASRLYEPRMFNYTHNGMLCAMETPEHKQVGLIKQLSMIGNITMNHKEQNMIIKNLIKDYIINSPNVSNNTSIVFLNGEWICNVRSEELNKFLETLRYAKLHNKLEKTVSISYNDITDEIFIWTDGGRFFRPILVVKNNKCLFDEVFDDKKMKELLTKEPNITMDKFIVDYPGLVEFIDCDEQNCAMIAITNKYLSNNKETIINDEDVDINNHYIGMFNNYTHTEIHPVFLLGLNTSTTPFVNHTNGGRTILHYGQGKQGMTIYNSAYRYRNDKAFLAYHPHRSLLTTQGMKYSYYDVLSPGENVIVAITSFTGFNQEDGIIVNKSALDRGLFNACQFEKFFDKVTKSSNGINDEFRKPDPNITTDNKKSNYEKLNENGNIPEEVEVEYNDIIIGKVSSIVNGTNQSKFWKDNSQTYKHYLPGIVDKVWEGITDEEGYPIKKMRVRVPLKPMMGDKFSTKSAQKGTICLILPEEDMPVTENGIVPDIIFNPVGIYNRITMGFLLELLFGKWCGIEGHSYDATGFEPVDINMVKEKLKKYGFNEYGLETMYNGMTGKKMESSILIGPLFYLRLKHIAADKIHARYEGPKTVLTRQPTEGRSRDGGLRIGNMEKDALVAHGISSFLKEKMLDDSDIYYTRVCGKCGTIATRRKVMNQSNIDKDGDMYYCHNCGEKGDIRKICIPYAFKLLLQEIESISVGVKIGTDEID